MILPEKNNVLKVKTFMFSVQTLNKSINLNMSVYEKHLYDKIPLECEARQCYYDADYDDSLSPLTFSGDWSEESSSWK